MSAATLLDQPAKQQRFAVHCTKHNGVEIVFSCYATRSEADAIARRLTDLGCPSRVGVVDTAR